jgi:hypothetical protein
MPHLKIFRNAGSHFDPKDDVIKFYYKGFKNAVRFGQ